MIKDNSHLIISIFNISLGLFINWSTWLNFNSINSIVSPIEVSTSSPAVYIFIDTKSVNRPFYQSTWTLIFVSEHEKPRDYSHHNFVYIYHCLLSLVYSGPTVSFDIRRVVTSNIFSILVWQYLWKFWQQKRWIINDHFLNHSKI